MELFLVDDCEDIPLGAVLGVVKVEHRPSPTDWAEQGGREQDGDMEEEERHFFYQKWLVQPLHRGVCHVPIPLQV